MFVPTSGIATEHHTATRAKFSVPGIRALPGNEEKFSPIKIVEPLVGLDINLTVLVPLLKLQRRDDVLQRSNAHR